MLFKTSAVIVLFILWICLLWFYMGLALGILLLFFLNSLFFWVIRKTLAKDNLLLNILLITFLVHFFVVVFMHYTNFQPFSGGIGDYMVYDSQAKEMANRFHNGDFFHFIGTYGGEYSTTYFSAIVGFLYAITVPEMLVGQLFGVWLSLICIFLVYSLVLEMGGTKKQAFIVGLVLNMYPSYLFYCSLLLKDILIVPLSIAGLFLLVRIIKKFSITNFVIFYLVMIVLTHFRFYIAYAIFITFFVCWVLFSSMLIKARLLYAAVMIILMGFIPMICGNGYMGSGPILFYLNPENVTFFREKAYFENTLNAGDIASKKPVIGEGSSIIVRTDLKNPVSFAFNYVETYIYVLLGPLPWQIKNLRQLLAVLETIPWYCILFFVIKGIINSINEYKRRLPILMFALIVMAVLALFTPNFGVITRIRMPAFMALLCFVPFGLDNKHKQN